MCTKKYKYKLTVIILFTILLLSVISAQDKSKENDAEAIEKELANPNAALETMAIPIDFIFFDDDLSNVNNHNAEEGGRFAFPKGTNVDKVMKIEITNVKLTLQYWYYIASPDTSGPKNQICFQKLPVIPLQW